MQSETLVTVGEAADRLGVQRWRLVRLFDRKLAPEPILIGRSRFVQVADLPEIRECARRAGYLKAPQAELMTA